ncbi:hypothetical protein BH23GEM8_BH23GEM8_21050 [soil metagenome]
MKEYGSFRAALLLVGLALILFTLFDYALAVRPIDPGEISWRFNAFTILSTAMVTPLIGLLFIFGALTGWIRPLQLTFSIGLGVAGLMILVAASIFVLDVIQLRGTVSPELFSQYDLNSGRAIFKLGVGGLVSMTLSALAFLSWKATPAPARKRRQVTTPSAPLVGAIREKTPV